MSEKTPREKELPGDEQDDIQGIIGLGQFSARKSYYPELQKTIAELRQERDKYERIFSEALSGIFQARPRGAVIVANPAMVQLCAYPSQQELTALKDISCDLFAVEEDYRKLANMLEERGVAPVFEASFKCYDGSIVDVLLNATLRCSADGEYIECFVENITERKLAEEKQLRLKKLESLGVLAGGIAHDFNNLLTGLVGNVDMARMSLPRDHRAQGLMNAAMKALENATGLTDQLMTFAKGGNPIKKAVALEPVIRDNASFIVQEENVELCFDIPGDLRRVKADKGQLGQVITNLVLNAQQAMPNGGRIMIKAENIPDSARPCVKVSVIDEGCGIDPADLEKIFDPYFTTKQHGNGLGLASTYMIVKKHQGNINVQSRPGKGTTFTIQLPAFDEVSSLEKASPSREKRILLLDAEDVVRGITATMLEEMGWQVTTCTKANEAVQYFIEAREKGHPFDLVMIDLALSGPLKADEVAWEIIRNDSRAILVATSGYANDPVMADPEAYGFSDCLLRPFRFAELKNVLSEALDRSRFS